MLESHVACDVAKQNCSLALSPSYKLFYTSWHSQSKIALSRERISYQFLQNRAANDSRFYILKKDLINQGINFQIVL